MLIGDARLEGNRYGSSKLETSLLSLGTIRDMVPAFTPEAVVILVAFARVL